MDAERALAAHSHRLGVLAARPSSREEVDLSLAELINGHRAHLIPPLGLAPTPELSSRFPVPSTLKREPMSEPSIEDEFVDLVRKHHEAVNVLVRALVDAHGIDSSAVEFDLEMGIDSERVQQAKSVLRVIFGGEDPYVLPPLVRLTQVQPTNRLHGSVMRHVANLEKPGICDNCGATFSRETYEWSEPPCRKVVW